MLKKVFSILLTVTSLLLFMTGCWDALDINKKNIVTTVLLDKKNDNYIIYIEIANTDSARSGSNEPAGGKSYITISAEGETIAAAREALEKKMDSPIYLGAARALILTENVANEDVAEYFNRLRADIEYRKKVISVTTSSDPKALFKFSEESGESVGFFVEEIFKNLVNLGQTFYRPTARFIENLASRYSCFLMPNIVIEDKIILINGYSVMKENKRVGMIHVKDTKGLIFLKSSNAEWRYVITHEDIKYTIKVKIAGSKIKPKYKDGKISFDIDFKMLSYLEYFDSSKNDKYNEKIKKILEGELEKTIKKEIENTILQSQKEYKCDYLSFDDEFHIAYPSIYHKLDWEKEYENINVNVNVKAELDTQIFINYENHKSE